MDALKLWQTMQVKTGERRAAVRGLLAPVREDTVLYARWADNAVGETRREVVRFFGTGAAMEDGVSELTCRGRRYLVLESRTVYAGGTALWMTAVLRRI